MPPAPESARILAAMMRQPYIFLLVFAAFALGTTGCAKPKHGYARVSVANEGVVTMNNFVMRHGDAVYQVGAVQPGESAKPELIELSDEKPFEVEYSTSGGMNESKSFEFRATPAHRGEIEYRLDRDGVLHSIERFYID